MLMSGTLTSEVRPQLKWHVGAADQHGRVYRRHFLEKVSARLMLYFFSFSVALVEVIGMPLQSGQLDLT